MTPSRMPLVSRIPAVCALALACVAAAPAHGGASAEDRIAEAQVWVERARARDALWSTALRNLRAARAAQSAGRADEAAALAAEAAELARLGLAQRDAADAFPPR